VTKWTGYIRLAVQKSQGRTVIKDSYHQGAYKIMRPYYPNDTGEVVLYAMNPGGGYVDGDTYRADVTLEQDAELVWTTQAATKIYKTPRTPVQQQLELRLAKGSRFAYWPDATIAYEAARFEQNTAIHMEAGSSLVYADLFTPGWSPDGSLFRYGRIRCKLALHLEEKLVLFDHLLLVPDADMQGIGMFDGYTHYGSIIIVDQKVNAEFIDQLHDQLQVMEGARGASVGMSLLDQSVGIVIRILAANTQVIERIVHAVYTTVREKCHGKESLFLRKY